MSLLKHLSMTSGVFFVLCVLSLVSAQNELELSSQSDLESLVEIQELLRNVQLIFETKIASKVRDGTVPEEENEDDENDPNGCRCTSAGLKCYCCKYINIRKLHLRGDCCLSIAYLPRNYGILVTMTYGGRTLISKEISARNPLPICVRIPKLRIIGEICIQFYNLDISKRSFSGCSRLLARVFYLTIVKIDVGCFHIHNLNATQEVNEVDAPYLDVAQASVEGLEPYYIGEVLMGNIKPSGYKKN